MVGQNSLQQTLRRSGNGNSCYVSLACSIGSIGLACGSLLQIPNSSDRISLQRGLFLTSLGFIYFVSLTDFCNKYLIETKHGAHFRRKYHLMISDVLDITNKIVSALQAAFSFLVGLIVCKSTCSRSFVYASHFLMEAYGWFGTAYFMYDIWSMYKVHTQKIADKLSLSLLAAANGVNGKANGKANGKCQEENGQSELKQNGHGIKATNGTAMQEQKNSAAVGKHEILDDNDERLEIPKDGRWGFLKYVITHPLIIIHHIFIGTFGLLVVTYIRGGGHCIYSYIYMMEFSTPFVSLRGILSILGMKETRAYVINGLLMLVTFFISRIYMWPHVMYWYSVAIDSTLWEATVGLPRGCKIAILILLLPQIYWFYLMLKGALKVFLPQKKNKKHLPKQEQQQQEEKEKHQQSKNNNLSPTTESVKDLEVNGGHMTPLHCMDNGGAAMNLNGK